MRKNTLVLLLSVLFTSCFIGISQAQREGGMGERCPMCGQQWGEGDVLGSIPDKLPKPENGEWVDGLKKALSLEKLSQSQYLSDQQKYNVNMPYMRVIPQENEHIDWITRLFGAYGIEPAVNVPPVKKTATVQEAYETGRQLESVLIPIYESLIKNAEDQDSRGVIENILFQTRMHRTMFEHALQMGGHGMMH